MLDGIGNGFLRDAKQMRGHGVICTSTGASQSKRQATRNIFSVFSGQFLQRGHQALGFQRHRRKPARQRARLADGIAHVAGDFARPRGGGF